MSPPIVERSEVPTTRPTTLLYGREKARRGPRLIAGSGRSGTTWLLDALARANGLRTVFEPLNPRGVRSARVLTRHSDDPRHGEGEIFEILEQALQGRLPGLWPNCRILYRELLPRLPLKAFAWNYRDLFRNSLRFRRDRRKPVITKLIRGNLILPEIVERFDARALLIVRHPAGVVASRLRFVGRPEWSYEARLARYLGDSVLSDETRTLVEEGFGGDRSEAAGHTALWCIENARLLEQAEQPGIPLVHFEPLVLREQAAWATALGALDLDRLPRSDRLAEPSERASHAFRHEVTPDGPVYRWRNSLGARELSSIDRMLKAFSVTKYSVDEPLPLTTHSSTVLARN